MDTESLKRAPLGHLLEQAWSARREGRPPVLEAIYPTKTLAVSVTGTSCALNCSHCAGHYLDHMVDVKDLRHAIARENPRSILLSGGCDLTGAVPLVAHLREVVDLVGEEASLGRGLTVNVHPGVASPEAARAIGDAATVVSFDFVLDDATIREAFHGLWSGKDYVESLRNLRKGKAEVVPHVLIGLKRGKIAGEYEAVDFLLKEGIERLIFIVFIPTTGTAWAGVPPPPVAEVARVIAWTRARAPGLDISLGCMRPAGKYRRDVDVAAVKCGVDRIVLPHPEALKEGVSRGLVVARKEECCAFD